MESIGEIHVSAFSVWLAEMIVWTEIHSVAAPWLRVCVLQVDACMFAWVGVCVGRGRWW